MSKETKEKAQRIVSLVKEARTLGISKQILAKIEKNAIDIIESVGGKE